MFLVAASRRALRFGSTPQNSRAQRCAPDVCSGATLLRRFRRPGANRVATRHAVWTERRRLAGRTLVPTDRAGRSGETAPLRAFCRHAGRPAGTVA